MIRPARVWLFLIGGALAYDVLALRGETATLSAWCHGHQKVTIVVGAYLMAHLIGHPHVLQRCDPLHALARVIPR